VICWLTSLPSGASDAARKFAIGSGSGDWGMTYVIPRKPRSFWGVCPEHAFAYQFRTRYRSDELTS